MAVIYEKGLSRCQVRLQNGFDGEGNPVFVNRMVSRIHPDTTHQDLYDVISAIMSLQILTVDAVRRLDDGELINE